MRFTNSLSKFLNMWFSWFEYVAELLLLFTIGFAKQTLDIIYVILMGL